jgi:hypothetical protein
MGKVSRGGLQRAEEGRQGNVLDRINRIQMIGKKAD